MKEAPVTDQVFLRKLTDIIHSNLENENFGVNELAHESGMSLYRLGRKLHSINKKTVNQFIREVRLQKALEMLQYEQYTAAEVAYRTGFGSPAYFNKCFHEFFGYAPGKVIKGESNINIQDNLIQANVNIKSANNRKAFVFTLPGILIFAVLLVLAGFLVFKRTQKSEWPNNLYTKNGRISIAVMPFLNMTGDTTWDNWQDGIQQDLISFFSNSKELRVRQKETVTTFLHAGGVSEYTSISPDVAGSISKKLDAGIFIYGNIQKAGLNIRVDAQLIETKTKEVLQSFEINGPYTEGINFTITDSLRMKITNFLLMSKLLKENPIYQGSSRTTDSPEAFRYCMYGNKAGQKGDNSMAIFWYLKALAVDSNFYDPMVGLSTVYNNLGMNEQNLEWVMKAFRKRNQWPIVEQLWAAWAYACNFESPEETITYLKQLQEIDEKGNYHELMGSIYFRIGKYAEAIPEFKKSLELNKRWGKEYLKGTWNWEGLAAAYHNTGLYRKEKRVYRVAAKYSGDEGWIMWHKAVLALSRKDTIRANQLIQKIDSFLHQSSWPEAGIKTTVGWIYREARDMDTAEKYLREAFSLTPDEPKRINNLAEFFIYSNRHIEEVPELMDKAMKLAPTRTDYYNYMNTKGYSYFKQGKNKEALEILEKTWNEAPFKLYSIRSHLEEVRNSVALNK